MNIKDEGRAGLKYAYDNDKKYVAAENAISGIPYTCPSCGCKMHPVHLQNGNSYFARNPHEIHKDQACISIESSGVVKSFKKCTPDGFIATLCHSTPRKGGLSGSKGSVVPVGAERSDAFVGDTDLTVLGVREVPFKSLKEIAASDLYALNPADRQGDYCISDYVLTFKYFKDFFTDPSFKLGARIVWCKYIWFNSTEKMLLFKMFDKKSNFQVVFALKFAKVSEFWEYRNKVDETVKINGKSVPRLHEVLLAADNWEFVPKNYCSLIHNSNDKTACDNCFGMFKATFTSAKQIYVIPLD